MHRPSIPAAVLALALFQLTNRSLGDEAGPPPQDLLRLAEQGKVSLEVVAESAYKLNIKMKNNTAEPINARLAPGLVADTYARFALFQVGGGGGTSNGSGGQSTGLLFAQDNIIPPARALQLNVQTVCLNFGAPEPTPKTVMMLKRAEDFTTDRVFQALLKDLAANPPEEIVSQAALWHIVDKLPWERLSRIRTRRGKLSEEDLTAAQSRVDAARSAASSENHLDPKPEEKKLSLLSVLVHPDPRGRHQDAEFARATAEKLRLRWPGVDVSHRNFTPPPESDDQNAVAWCFFVRSTGPAKSPDLQIALQRNVWNSETKAWKHDPLGPAASRTPPKEKIADWLAERIIEQIAAKSLTIERQGEGRLLVKNVSPVEVHDVFVTPAGPRDKAMKLLGLWLAPGESKTATIPAENQGRYAAVKKLAAVGFTPSPTAKAPSGG
jgi:hypothetical protein